MAKQPEFPLTIRKGSATAKVYFTPARGRDLFTLSYWTAGKRQRFTFADAEAAIAEAKAAVAKLDRGDVITAAFKTEDVAAYQRAVALLKPLGIPLEAAVAEYVQMKKRQGVCERRTVKQVVDELLKLKKEGGRGRKPASDRYEKDLRLRLTKFADDFACNITEINATQIVAWLDGLEVGGRTWFNYARLLRTLFNYAKAQRYIPVDIDPMEGISLDYEDDGEIEIFTPDELKHFLSKARSEMIPLLAIGAFAGLRTAEICRLDWSEVKADFIEVTKGKAKTRSRRLVPIQPNLKAWLADYRKDSGAVIPFANIGNQFPILSKEAKMDWKHNGLRHSYISYRLAVIHNEHQVAMECGNSPQMIYGNYRQLVTPERAAEWFSISPK